MNKIVIYRSHIEIQDYDLKDCPQLERNFSIWDSTYHRSNPMGRIYDDNRRILMLPRGIDIGYLERLFQCEAHVDMSMDTTADIGHVGLKYKPRDTDQEEALKFMLSLGQYENNKYHTMLSLNLNTGKGKSYCSIAAMAYMGIRGMVITDSLAVLDQWKDFILQYTDIKPSEIYLLSGAPSVGKLYNRDISGYKIILASHGTLLSIGKTQGWESVRSLFQYLKIGIKIFDEAHLNFDNMFYIDCYSNTFITYYITATPGRSDFNQNTIYGLYFKNVPCIDLFNKDEDPHTKYIGIRYNSNPTPIEVSKCKNKYGLNRVAYANYLVQKDNFYMLLRILLNMALNKPGKTLYYIGTNAAIRVVEKWIYENYPELRISVGIYTSLTSENKRAQLEKKIILTTTKSAGVAVDIKNLVEAVVLAEPFKSRVLAQQTFGRTRGQDTCYKDTVDIGFLSTKKFYEFKKPVFKKYAVSCQEINLTQKELESRSNAIIEARSKLTCPVNFNIDKSVI